MATHTQGQPFQATGGSQQTCDRCSCGSTSMPSEVPASASGCGKPGCTHKTLTDPSAILVDLFRAESMDCNIDEAMHLFNLYFAPNAVINGAFPGQRDMSVSGYKEWYRALKHSMPDVNCVLYDVTQGSGTGGAPIVWARFSKLGRFEHPLYGIPATGRHCAMTGVMVCRFTRPGSNPHLKPGEQDRPRIDYCEIYQDNLATLSSLGVDLSSAMPSTLKHMLGSVTGGGGGGMGQGMGVGNVMGMMGLGSMNMGNMGEKVSHAAENISEAVSSLAEKAKEALGISGGTAAGGMGTGMSPNKGGTTSTKGVTSGGLGSGGTGTQGFTSQ